jgi:hypothetical protein
MYRHDFKALWKKMIADKILYKTIKSTETSTATSISVDTDKDNKKKETFMNDPSMSSEHNKINENKLHSPSAIPSGPGSGPPANVFSREELEQYMLNPSEFKDISHFIFDGHITPSAVDEKLKNNQSLLQCQIPISKLVSNNMSLSVIKSLCREHNINLISKLPKINWISACSSHHCNLCDDQITTFSKFTLVKSNRELKAAARRQTSEFKIKKRVENKTAYNKKKSFPPSPVSTTLLENVANGFCETMSPEVFSESGCTVCCMLTMNTSLKVFFSWCCRTCKYACKNLIKIFSRRW